jgi:hypothetical protein
MNDAFPSPDLPILLDCKYGSPTIRGTLISLVGAELAKAYAFPFSDAETQAA